MSAWQNECCDAVSLSRCNPHVEKVAVIAMIRLVTQCGLRVAHPSSADASGSTGPHSHRSESAAPRTPTPHSVSAPPPRLQSGAAARPPSATPQVVDSSGRRTILLRIRDCPDEGDGQPRTSSRHACHRRPARDSVRLTSHRSFAQRPNTARAHYCARLAMQRPRGLSTPRPGPAHTVH
jgi:hypothetical protein